MKLKYSINANYKYLLIAALLVLALNESNSQNTVEVLIDRYSDVEIVVSGHVLAGGINCLKQTLSLSSTHD